MPVSGGGQQSSDFTSKDVLNWIVPAAIGWILAALTGTYSAIVSNRSTGVFPVTIVAFFVTGGIAGFVCFALATMYLWSPTRRFDSLPRTSKGRKPRKALLTELEDFENETRVRILSLVPLAERDPEEWFKQTEVQFSAYTTSRSLRKGFPEMRKAAARARYSITLVGFVLFLSGIFVAYAPQNLSAAFVAVAGVGVVGFLGVVIGFYAVDDIPRRSDWGSDVSTLCDATSYEDMKETLVDWAEREVRAKRLRGR